MVLAMLKILILKMHVTDDIIIINDDNDFDANEILMNWDWLCTSESGIFIDIGNAIQRLIRQRYIMVDYPV